MGIRRVDASDRKRRLKVGWLSRKRAKHYSTDPPEVVHALDFFLWAVSDDRNLMPTDIRAFGDDERHYNDVLNRHFLGDLVRDGSLTSTAVETEPRFAGMKYVSHAFPDDPPDLFAATLKDHGIALHISDRVERLRAAAEMSVPLREAEGVRARDLLLAPERYVGYYTNMRQAGVLFADAAPIDRELAPVRAMRSAVMHAEPLLDPAGGHVTINDTGGWFVIDARVVAKELLADFLEPEALLPRQIAELASTERSAS